MNRDNARELLALLGLLDDAHELLVTALSHPSFVNEGLSSSGQSNQRLEFLGDSVLGLIVAEKLYREHPELDEGRLTEMRASIVREESLAEAATRMGLGRYLLMGKGADETGDRYRPSVLSDAFEAVLGVVYLVKGLEGARAFVDKWLGQAFRGEEQVLRDSKSRLQELVVKTGQAEVRYKVIDESGPDHDKRFRVSLVINGKEVAQGVGRSKKQAEQDAASNALSSGLFRFTKH